MDAPSWGDVILAATAVGAAGIAAATANHRMGRQLSEESERLNRQLDEESKRLDRQLTHDRRMRESEELRATVDGAAGAAIVAADDLEAVGAYLGKVFDDDDIELDKSRLSALVGTAKSSYVTAGRFWPRIFIRFGIGDPISDCYWDIQKALKKGLETVEQLPADRWVEELDKSLTECADELVRFTNLCAPYVRVATNGSDSA